MEIENFKRWHWIVIALVLGTVIGSIMMYYGADVDSYSEQTLNMPAFEALMLDHRFVETGGPGLPTNLRVYPISATEDAVIGSIIRYDLEFPTRPRNDKNKEVAVMTPFLFTIRVPYPNAYRGNERVGAAEKFRNNREYLEKMKATFPDAKVEYRYAWWSQPKMVMVLWIAGTMVVVGGIWPTLMSVLIGAGYGPKRAPKKIDPRIAAEEARRKEAAALAEKAALAAMRANKQAEPPPPPKEEKEAFDHRKYGGTFYPTATHTRKKEHE